jgi:hypothetical protein
MGWCLAPSLLIAAVYVADPRSRAGRIQAGGGPVALWRASGCGRRGQCARRRRCSHPPPASSAVHVFAPTDLYELLPRGESGASAAALGALAARQALSSTSRLHAALCSLLDTPPAAAAAAAAPTVVASGDSLESDAAGGSSALLWGALGAQAYRVTWRLVGAFPAADASPTPLLASEALVCSPLAARVLLRSVVLETAADAGTRGAKALRIATWLAAAGREAADASLSAGAGERGRGGRGSLTRACALTSGLALCLDRLAAFPSSRASSAAGTGASDDEDVPPLGMRMSDGAGAGEAPTPLLDSDEDFAAVLRDLADATSSLAAAARAKSRTIFPPFLAASPADTDLAVAVAGSGLETARVSLLLTYLGGTAAAKQLGTIGEPLPPMLFHTADALIPPPLPRRSCSARCSRTKLPRSSSAHGLGSRRTRRSRPQWRRRSRRSRQESATREGRRTQSESVKKWR